METRYKLSTCGYVDVDNLPVEPKTIYIFETEDEAAKWLLNMTDYEQMQHMILKENYVNIAQNHYDWQGDEHYSDLGDYKMYWHFCNYGLKMSK